MSDFNYVADKNDHEARDRAFYLLKKYTSATSLRRAIDLYREFLREFEREIRRPEVEIDYSDDLLRFLRFLEPMEIAEPLLANPARRAEAFGLLREGIAFGAYIWGRRYEEQGAADPSGLFYKLGYRSSPDESCGLFGKANVCGNLLSSLVGCINKTGRVYFEDARKVGPTARSAMCWTYESIFYDTLPVNAIQPIQFPPHLATCPPPNKNSHGEVRSGQIIPITGIWEPWAIDPKIGVRCPNYYLAGDTASQYQFEQTDTLEDVRWRLIWKDTRYEDGRIPSEEREYFALQPPATPNDPFGKRALPGEKCPEGGAWFSPVLRKAVHVKTGETMPGPEPGKTGSVIWYLKPRLDSGQPR